MNAFNFEWGNLETTAAGIREKIQEPTGKDAGDPQGMSWTLSLLKVCIVFVFDRCYIASEEKEQHFQQEEQQVHCVVK